MSQIWLPDSSKLAINQENKNNVIICWHDVIVKFFDNVMFLLLSLVTGSSFMTISLLVLELWQCSFIRDWPEIWKLEIPLSEFCPITGDWSKLPNLTQRSLMKCYWMLPNARVTSFTVSKLLRENQQRALTNKTSTM